MKNEDIHNSFSEKEIRDFLGKRVGFGYDGEVEIIESQINELNEKLKKAKESQAARDLVKSKGWEEFDVSDDISDYKYGEYFSFVGTKKEYKQLMETMQND